MKILNYDQVQRMRIMDERKILKEFMKRVFIAFVLFLLMAVAIAIHAIEPAQASIPQADQSDFMISEDYRDYMIRYGNGVIFNDMRDVE